MQPDFNFEPGHSVDPLCVEKVLPRWNFDPTCLWTNGVGQCSTRAEAKNSDSVCLRGFKLLYFGKCRNP